MAEKLATLSFTDGSPPVDFPVVGGTLGPEVIDIRPLYNKTGKFKLSRKVLMPKPEGKPEGRPQAQPQGEKE